MSSGNENNGTHSDAVLVEYSSVQEERRFVISRYMQGFAFYIAMVAFVGGNYFDSEPLGQLFLLVFMCTANTLAWMGAGHFRDMAYHALTRETKLARKLGAQEPYPLIWGYKYALVLGSVVQISVLLELVHWIVRHTSV